MTFHVSSGLSIEIWLWTCPCCFWPTIWNHRGDEFFLVHPFCGLSMQSFSYDTWHIWPQIVSHRGHAFWGFLLYPPSYPYEKFMWVHLHPVSYLLWPRSAIAWANSYASGVDWTCLLMGHPEFSRSQGLRKCSYNYQNPALSATYDEKFHTFGRPWSVSWYWFHTN